MIAYRTETNTKTTKSACLTTHLKNFNYAEITEQEVSFSLALGNIELGPNKHQSFRIAITFPSQIPLLSNSCFAKDQVLFIDLACIVISNVGNTASIEITHLEAISITSL